MHFVVLFVILLLIDYLQVNKVEYYLFIYYLQSSNRYSHISYYLERSFWAEYYYYLFICRVCFGGIMLLLIFYLQSNFRWSIIIIYLLFSYFPKNSKSGHIMF